ncbi:hypothetical protein D3C71_1330570 [compost metagenome]
MDQAWLVCPRHQKAVARRVALVMPRLKPLRLRLLAGLCAGVRPTAEGGGVKVWGVSGLETTCSRTRRKFPLFKLEFKWLESKDAAAALVLALAGHGKR